MEQAAQDLGYRPNGFARGMNTGRSDTIGVIHEGIENPIFAVAMRGIIDAAAEQGVTVVMMNTGGTAASERKAIDILLSQHVDGLIICPANSFDVAHLHDLKSRGVPLVLWERRIPDLDVPVVEVDSRSAMNEFMDHALELGHRRIGFISTAPTGPKKYSPGMDVGPSLISDRLATLTARQQAAFGEDSSDVIRFATSGTPDEVARVTREIFETSAPPSLLLTSDNEIALIVVPELERMGLKIPADVCLATYDDVSWALLTTPKTTVIAQPTYEMAHAAAQMLLKLRAGEDVPTPVAPFPASIHWRGSVTRRASVDGSGAEPAAS
uniref:LacI family DNA-binding transcriptional regulator n=1 Tax=Paenarthrobacter ureafaciens TaxID=37931 RepID=UPI003F495BFD